MIYPINDEVEGHDELRRLLDNARDVPLPERPPEYGAQVWARLAAQLPPRPASTVRWLLPSALAAFLTMAVLGSLWIQRDLRLLPPLTIARQRIPAPVMPTLAKAEVDKRPPRPRNVTGRVRELPKAAIPQIVRLVEGDTPDVTKERALYVLAESSSVEAHQTLLTFAQRSSNPSLQVSAMKVMRVTGGFSDNDADVLANVLKSQQDPRVRVASIRSLAVVGDRSVALMNAYRSDGNAEVRKAVLDALVNQGNSEALSILAKQEIDPRWTKEIMERLGMIKAMTTSSPEP